MLQANPRGVSLFENSDMKPSSTLERVYVLFVAFFDTFLFPLLRFVLPCYDLSTVVFITCRVCPFMLVLAVITN